MQAYNTHINAHIHRASSIYCSAMSTCSNEVHCHCQHCQLFTQHSKQHMHQRDVSEAVINDSRRRYAIAYNIWSRILSNSMRADQCLEWHIRTAARYYMYCALLYAYYCAISLTLTLQYALSLPKLYSGRVIIMYNNNDSPVQCDRCVH
jgi:hypothetical protein